MLKTDLFRGSKGAVTTVRSHGPCVLHAGYKLALEEGIFIWHRDGHAAWVNVPRSQAEAVVIAAPDRLVGVNWREKKLKT